MFKDTIEIIGIIILAFIILIGVAFLIVCGVFEITSGVYKYKDLDNNIGYAENCFIDDGYSNCYLKDGTVIKVKEYKKID